MESIEMKRSEKEPWFPLDMSLEMRVKVRNLVLAAKNGNEEHVVELLENGKVDIDSKYRWETALIATARTNNVNLCKILLNHGADCNVSRYMQQTPLWIAACYGNIQVMELILERKTCTQINLDNALRRCVAMKFSFGCEALLEAGADVQAIDSNGFTALHLAAGSTNDDWGETELWRVHNLETWELYLSTTMEITELLIMWNADVNAVDFYKCTPLHYACKTGEDDVMQLLIENKADVNAVGGTSSKTPLHLLVDNDFPYLIETFLKNLDIQPNIVDNENDTPLMLAIKLQKKECVKMFLSHKNWVNFMSVVSHGSFGKHENVDTPMRQLILHMPDLACNIMDKCIELSSHKDPKNPEFLARFNFFLLDDTYTCGKWMLPSSNNIEHTIPNARQVEGYENLPEPSFHGSTLSGLNIENGINTVDGKHTLGRRPTIVESWSYTGNNTDTSTAPACDPIVFSCSETLSNCVLQRKSRPYSTNRKFVKVNHPLYIAYLEKRNSVLNHPLAIALINQKWQRTGRFSFYGGLFMYLVFVILLTLHIIWTDMVTVSNSTDAEIGKLNGNSSFDSKEQQQTNKPLSIIAIVVLVLCGLSLTKELFASIANFPTYLFEISHWLDTAVYLMVSAIVLDEGVLNHSLLPKEYPLAAICIFTAWFNVLLAFRQFPMIGIYFIMFMRILRKSCMVLLIFFPIILGFALTFSLLLDFKPLFSTEHTLATVLVMLSGEVDYAGTIASNDNLNGNIKNKGITITVYVVFIVVMVICLLNLLVGLAVSDVETLHRESESEMTSLKAEHVLTSEYYLSLVPYQRVACGCLRYTPNKKTNLLAFGRRRTQIKRSIQAWFNVFNYTDSRLGPGYLMKNCRKEKEEQSINWLREENISLRNQLGVFNVLTPRSSTIRRKNYKKRNAP